VQQVAVAEECQHESCQDDGVESHDGNWELATLKWTYGRFMTDDLERVGLTPAVICLRQKGSGRKEDNTAESW
jgi:hypothetical protein